MKYFIYYVQIVKITKKRKQKKCNVLKISVGVTKHIPVSSLTEFFVTNWGLGAEALSIGRIATK